MTNLTKDDSRLRAFLFKGRAKAAALGRPILVSSVEPAPELDSLMVLENLAARCASDSMLETMFREGSAYWLRGNDELALAGLGAVATIASEGTSRFEGSDAAWAAILDGSLIDDQSDRAIGTGRVLIGGFAFEPEGPRSEPWSGFPSGHLIVPRALLTSADGLTWITMSALIGPDADVEAEVAALIKLRDTTLAAADAGNSESARDEFTSGVEFQDERDPADWRAGVVATTDAIRNGTLEKVVLARASHAQAPNDIDPYATLRALRDANRNAFVFGYWRGATAFVGASPERLIRLDKRNVQASSLAGTARRGGTDAEEAEIVAELFASAKDRIEHAVVLSALKEVLAEFCDDVTASSEPSLMTLPNVHHLETDVHGCLRPGNSLLKVIERLHPTPAVGGTPRDLALQFIRDVEMLDRGWYAGPIGWIGRDGGEFAVALRSAILYGSEAMLFAGCGIVADSEPDLEFAESVLKLQPMKSAISLGVAMPSSGSTIVAAAPG
ncbi:MAG: isochorismate synthase [Gemmatimonadales bacterium]